MVDASGNIFIESNAQTLNAFQPNGTPLWTTVASCRFARLHEPGDRQQPYHLYCRCNAGKIQEYQFNSAAATATAAANTNATATAVANANATATAAVNANATATAQANINATSTAVAAANTNTTATAQANINATSTAVAAATPTRRPRRRRISTPPPRLRRISTPPPPQANINAAATAAAVQAQQTANAGATCHGRRQHPGDSAGQMPMPRRRPSPPAASCRPAN